MQFVADGVFYAELNELLVRELAEDGYSGVEVRVTPLRTEIIIRATRTQGVLGEWLGGCHGGAGVGRARNLEFFVRRAAAQLMLGTSRHGRLGDSHISEPARS